MWFTSLWKPLSPPPASGWLWVCSPSPTTVPTIVHTTAIFCGTSDTGTITVLCSKRSGGQRDSVISLFYIPGLAKPDRVLGRCLVYPWTQCAWGSVPGLSLGRSLGGLRPAQSTFETAQDISLSELKAQEEEGLSCAPFPFLLILLEFCSYVFTGVQSCHRCCLGSLLVSRLCLCHLSVLVHSRLLCSF